MPETSIVIKAEDRYSDAIKKMSTFTKSFSKDVDGLENQLHALNSQKVSLKIDLDAAKRELKEAQKQFAKTGDEADGLKMQLQQANYDNIKRNFDLVTRAARDTERQFLQTRNGASGMMTGLNNGFRGVIGAIAASGGASMIGDAVMEAANAGISSAFGDSIGQSVSSILSGAVSGGVMGAAFGLPGIAIGAAAGGITGAISGGSQAFQSYDSEFKSYVQEQYNTVAQEQADSLTTGSALAAQRETDLISFSTLFGGRDIAEQYLADLVEMANNTPFLYGDLTAMSKTMATYGYSPEDILPDLTTIGDTGAALGQSTADMNMVATALGRMKSSDKATLEYLNILNDRGIGAVGMLSDAFGVEQGAMYDMISKGEVSGREAARIILEAMSESFSGSMEEQAKTFSGITSTVEGLTQELDNAMGEGYNEGRMAGLTAQRDWLSGESGAAVMEANKAIGAWKAELENSKEKYIRDAVDAMMETEAYQTARAEGDAAEMGRLIMQAKVQGMNEYNSSEGAQLALEAELSLAEAIRNDTESDNAYWDAGYRKGQQFSTGLTAGMFTRFNASMSEKFEAGIQSQWDDIDPEDPRLDQNSSEYDPAYAFLGYATGLERVPYNNYPALLHEGERVLTAGEARAYDRGGGVGGVQIVMNGTVIREDADIDRVAQQLLDKIRQAKTAGVY